MAVYKYVCMFCGQVSESAVFRGAKTICGKCRRTTAVLMGADKKNRV